MLSGNSVHFYVLWELSSYLCFLGTQFIFMLSALMSFGNPRNVPLPAVLLTAYVGNFFCVDHCI